MVRELGILIVIVGVMGTPARAAESNMVLSVAEKGGAEFTTIQDALNAAPTGATIRIAAGLYPEVLRITKPVTLVGETWLKTLVLSTDDGAPWDFEAVLQGVVEGDDGATNTAAAGEAVLKGSHRVIGTTGVTLSNLTFSVQNRQRVGGYVPMAVLDLYQAEVIMQDCVLTGSPGDGMHVRHGSQALVRSSLIAGVWGHGILIAALEPGRAMNRIRIEDSELRHCYRGGLWFAAASNGLVTRNRISGCSGHGIRYDLSSPRVIGNAIFGNQRSGMYGTGGNVAWVSGNLFWNNRHSGISCLMGSQDAIMGNTFVANAREAIGIYGASGPLIDQNVICESPRGIVTADVDDDAPLAKSTGFVNLRSNLFWQVGSKVVHLVPGDEGKPPVETVATMAKEAALLEAEPGFVNADGHDFALTPDGYAAKHALGAGRTPGTESQWPLQIGEIATQPRATRRAKPSQ